MWPGHAKIHTSRLSPTNMWAAQSLPRIDTTLLSLLCCLCQHCGWNCRFWWCQLCNAEHKVVKRYSRSGLNNTSLLHFPTFRTNFLFFLKILYTCALYEYAVQVAYTHHRPWSISTSENALAYNVIINQLYVCTICLSKFRICTIWIQHYSCIEFV